MPTMILVTALSLALTTSGDLRIEEAKLATLPQGVELEGPPLKGADGADWPNVNHVVWSRDGQRVAYVGLRGGKR